MIGILVALKVILESEAVAVALSALDAGLIVATLFGKLCWALNWVNIQ